MIMVIRYKNEEAPYNKFVISVVLLLFSTMFNRTSNPPEHFYIAFPFKNILSQSKLPNINNSMHLIWAHNN